MNLLIIGEFHIPDRKKEIPFEIWQEIEISKFDLILCTGDLTDIKILYKLENLAPTKIVHGNMDYYFGLRDLPSSLVLNLSNCKIGLFHGSGIRPRGNPAQLVKIASKMQVNVLISGHTHVLSITVFDHILLLNPGSATGSWGGGSSTGIPSYLILEEINNELKLMSVFLKAGKLTHQTNFYNIRTCIIK